MQKLVLFFISLCFASLMPAQQYCNNAKVTDALGNEDVLINCTYPLQGECLSLKVAYPTFHRTETYEVSPANFQPYGQFNEGTPLHADADDLFLKKVTLPFDFCFFGNNYREVVIGTNGMLTFESAQFGSINYPNVEEQNPSEALPRASIFGAFSDMVFRPDNDSEIYYSITGVAPCRKLVVNFYRGRLVGCEQPISSQIVLHEGSNIIEIFVENKPLPCSTAKFKNSLIGIINFDRTLGYSPEGRNSGVWMAQNEAYRFFPSGDAVIPSVNWFDETGKQVGSGDTVTVCPDQNKKYTAKVSYPLCGAQDFVLEDTATVTFAPDFPLARNYNHVFCGSASQTVNLRDYRSQLTSQNPDDLLFTFHLTRDDASSGANPQPDQAQVTAARTYYVRVQNPGDPDCYRVAELNFNLISQSMLTHQVTLCDNENDGVERNYLLAQLNDKLFAAPLNGTLQYYRTEQDATAGTNELKRADLTAGMQLFVNYKTQNCNQVFGPVTINFTASPDITSPIQVKVSTCDFKRDNTEPYDFLAVVGPKITTNPDFTITFYPTRAQALSGSGPSLTTIREGKYEVYARVENSAGCYSIAVIEMDVFFTKVESIHYTASLCFDGTEDVAVDLSQYAPLMLKQSPVGITTGYFKSEADAEQNQNEISPQQLITENGNLVTKVFYIRFADATDCFAVKRLTVNLVHVVIAKDAFTACDLKNDGREEVTLADYSKAIAGNQNAVVSYFKTQDQANSNTGPISKAEVNGTLTLYVRITSYGCFNIFPIEIKLTPTPDVKPVVTLTKNAVCDNNNDGEEPVNLTVMEKEIFSGAGVSFAYFKKYNPDTHAFSEPISDPKAYVVAGAGKVFVRVSYAGGCSSASEINIRLHFLPAIVLQPAALQKCDYDFNNNESFVLSDAVSQLYQPAENTYPLTDLTITYHKTKEAADVGGPQIKSPFVTARSLITVWARFTSKTNGCYSVAPVELQSYMPPKARNSTIADICDPNLDGLYELDLTAHTAGMVYQASQNNIFKFYKTKADAERNVNQIENPAQFEFEPSLTRIWVRVENIPGCFDVATVDLRTGKKVTLNPGPYLIDECDAGNDQLETVDLTQFERQLFAGTAQFTYYPTFEDLKKNQNQILVPNAYQFNQKSGRNTVVVKVNAPGFCPEKSEITLKLRTTPMFTVPDQYFCPGVPITIAPDLSELDLTGYEWRNPANQVVGTTAKLPNVMTEGTYHLTVTARNGCTFTAPVKVFAYEVPVITKLVAEGNTYTVIATGSRKILYSIDGKNFQESNVFTNLPAGVIDFYVKFADRECLGEMKQGLILNVKNAFTPNDDGRNDTWVIDDLYVFDGKTTNLKIYNRYQQKIYEQDSATRLEWNGKTASRVVPTDSYWYVLTLADGRVFTGWIMVKDRN